jgi:hypothetical protein
MARTMMGRMSEGASSQEGHVVEADVCADARVVRTGLSQAVVASCELLAEAEDQNGRARGEIAGQRDGVAVECGAGGCGDGGGKGWPRRAAAGQ